jgi:asparaginyl-tRNA synthetase
MSREQAVFEISDFGCAVYPLRVHLCARCLAMRPSRRTLAALPRTVRAVLEHGPSVAGTSAPADSAPTSSTEIRSDADLRALLDGAGPSSVADSPAGRAQVHGWLRSVRAHKNVAFLEVDDGTGRVQGVLKGKGRAEG